MLLLCYLPVSDVVKISISSGSTGSLGLALISGVADEVACKLSSERKNIQVLNSMCVTTVMTVMTDEAFVLICLCNKEVFFYILCISECRDGSALSRLIL